jgi:hypothetical protein
MSLSGADILQRELFLSHLTTEPQFRQSCVYILSERNVNIYSLTSKH